MKYSFITIFASLLLCTIANAQKKVSELSVVYDCMITSGNPSKPVNGFDGTTNTIYIKGNLIRSEMASSSFSSSTIYDSKTGRAVILKEVSGQKLLIRLSPENWQEMNKHDNGIVFTATGETKTIAGYKCIKAIGKTIYGAELIVYYTAEIVPDNKDYSAKFKNLEGLPLQYELTFDNRKIIYTVAKISLNPVPASKFDLPKKGYREMTYEESKKQKGNN